MMGKLQPPRLALGLARFVGVFPGECKLLVAVGERPKVCLLFVEGISHYQIERGRARKPRQTFLGNLPRSGETFVRVRGEIPTSP
jgi:hypothetical protein